MVASRTLARGTVVREGDVELRARRRPTKCPARCTRSPKRWGTSWCAAVVAGSPVTADTLRQPLVVHRGEVVTVLARAGGIRIRTNARARDDGSVGELVAVESLLNRSTYYARVSGVREVEVYARPMQVENDR